MSLTTFTTPLSTWQTNKSVHSEGAGNINYHIGNYRYDSRKDHGYFKVIFHDGFVGFYRANGVSRG